MIGLGGTRPWVFSNLQAKRLLDDRSALAFSFGQGSHKFEGKRIDQTFELQINSRTLDVSYQWYLNYSIPFVFNIGTGFVNWDGDVNPVGVAQSVESQNLLRSGISARGLYGFSSLLIHANWNNGFFIEYCIFGIGTSHVLDLTLTNQTADSEAVLKKALLGSQSYGFTNIALGWYF
jgi:hypothetical protein